MLAEALALPVIRPFGTRHERRAIRFGSAPGDLYSVASGAPGIVLVPGAAELGKEDPRVVRLATALATSNRNVFVPELTLARRRLVAADIDRLRAATRGLAERTGGKIVLLGFSYGGSFALLAAAHRATAQNLRLVAVFGAYFDLVGVIQAATTGASIASGRAFPWEPAAAVHEIVAAYGIRLAPKEQRAALTAALEHRSTADLEAEARAVFDLLSNRDPRRTRELVDRLPQRARILIDRFSPAVVSDRLTVPVLAMHSTGDPAVPFAEILRLENALPQARTIKLSSFRHIDFKGLGAVRVAPDLLKVWGFATEVLSSRR